jgi:hypothetical protein
LEFDPAASEDEPAGVVVVFAILVPAEVGQREEEFMHGQVRADFIYRPIRSCN